MKRSEPFDCPNCGAEVPAGAKACPECGSDEKTGWNEEEAVYNGTGIEEPKEFNYDEWTKKEGVEPTRSSNMIFILIVFMVAAAVLVALAFIFWRR